MAKRDEHVGPYGCSVPEAQFRSIRRNEHNSSSISSPAEVLYQPRDLVVAMQLFFPRTLPASLSCLLVAHVG